MISNDYVEDQKHTIPIQLHANRVQTQGLSGAGGRGKWHQRSSWRDMGIRRWTEVSREGQTLLLLGLCVVQTPEPGATWNEKQDRAVITLEGGWENAEGQTLLGQSHFYLTDVRLVHKNSPDQFNFHAKNSVNSSVLLPSPVLLHSIPVALERRWVAPRAPPNTLKGPRRESNPSLAHW